MEFRKCPFFPAMIRRIASHTMVLGFASFLPMANEKIERCNKDG
jgi:hypothetical protein